MVSEIHGERKEREIKGKNAESIHVDDDTKDFKDVDDDSFKLLFVNPRVLMCASPGACLLLLISSTLKA
jgi:hypothetical protein